jgi:hypothetical protein
MSVAYYSPIAAYAKSKKSHNETSSESSDTNNAPLKELGQSNLGKIKVPPGGIRVNESDLGGIKLPPGGGKIKVPPGLLENPPFENVTPNNPTTPPPKDNTTGGTGGTDNTNNNNNNNNNNNTNTNTNTNNNNNTNTNTNANTNTNTNANTNTNTNTNTNVNQNTVLSENINQNTIKNSIKINNQLNNVIKAQSAASSATGTITTSLTSRGPFVDLETISLGKSVFAAGGIRPLADVFPFHVIGGHISLNSVSGNTVNLIVAQITDRGVEHAVVVNLHQTLNVIAGKEILYHTDLGQVIRGTNPFSGQPDTVSNITDLILWNNSIHDVVFNDDNAVTMTIIYQ